MCHMKSNLFVYLCSKIIDLDRSGVYVYMVTTIKKAGRTTILLHLCNNMKQEICRSLSFIKNVAFFYLPKLSYSLKVKIIQCHLVKNVVKHIQMYVINGVNHAR